MVTETWLNKGRTTARNIEDLNLGEGLSCFFKYREGRSGGGVAIFLKDSLIRMKKGMDPQLGKAEAVVAISKDKFEGRNILAMAIYVPPSLNVAEKEAVVSALVDYLIDAKVRHGTPWLLKGGDFNKLQLDELTNALPELESVVTGATRQDAVLDMIVTNFPAKIGDHGVLTETVTSEEGIASDHYPVYISASFYNRPKKCSEEFSYLRITEEGVSASRTTC
jgi:hypothetical protein